MAMWRVGKKGSVYKVKKRGTSRRKTYGTKARAKAAAKRR
jgi:hypothetical protein